MKRFCGGGGSFISYQDSPIDKNTRSSEREREMDPLQLTSLRDECFVDIVNNFTFSASR